MHCHFIMFYINRPFFFVYFAFMLQSTPPMAYFPLLNICSTKLCQKCSNGHWLRGRLNLRKTFLCWSCAELGWKRPQREPGFYGLLSRILKFTKKQMFKIKDFGCKTWQWIWTLLSMHRRFRLQGRFKSNARGTPTMLWIWPSSVEALASSSLSFFN